MRADQAEERGNKPTSHSKVGGREEGAPVRSELFEEKRKQEQSRERSKKKPNPG